MVPLFPTPDTTQKSLWVFLLSCTPCPNHYQVKKNLISTWILSPLLSSLGYLLAHLRDLTPAPLTLSLSWSLFYDCLLLIYPLGKRKKKKRTIDSSPKLQPICPSPSLQNSPFNHQNSGHGFGRYLLGFCGYEVVCLLLVEEACTETNAFINNCYLNFVNK